MPRLADRRARIELLRAAEAAFCEHGLAAAKVEAITERAGVSKGAFYLHFRSKSDCFQQIVESFIARLADCVEPPPGLFDLGPASAKELLARVHAHDVEVLEFCWQNRALLRMMLAGGGGTPYAYLIDELAERVGRQVEERVRHAVAVGLYRDAVDPAVTAALVSGAYDRLVRELIHAPSRPDIAAWCAQAVHLFAHGLLTEAARSVADPAVTLPPRAAADAPEPRQAEGSAPAAERPGARSRATRRARANNKKS